MARLIDAEKLHYVQMLVQNPDNGKHKHIVAVRAKEINKAPTVDAIPIEKLEDMYDKFQKKLWREREDVLGNDMVEMGYAEQSLQELLMEFGCWDKENKDV